jgi:outer membrane receptor protein involved in Fe transport
MKFLLLLPFLLIGSCLSAQNKGTPASLNITGLVTDSITQKPVPGATVEIVSKDNTQYKGNAISDFSGKFTVKNVPALNNLQVTITAIGYGTEILHTSLTKSDFDLNKKDIGTVQLPQATNTLKNVVVTATAAPAMQFGIDRKIFNVEKNITSQGGTAVDVMKNIPSLSVDVDGNVQMRNASPQILIDGRPTILTLDQIAADDIERVELITNPSAKYDASAAGGIINIVLKKNKRVGLNGIASVGAGSPSVLTGHANLNLREKKFNLFASGNYNRSGGTSKEKAYRINKDNGVPTDYFNQSSENDRTRKFHSIRFGMDYYLDDKNTLSFTQSFNRGEFGNTETQNQEYLDINKTLEYTGYRTTNGLGNFSRNSSRLSFERQFDEPDSKLTADITYNKGGNGDNDIIVNSFFNPDGGIYEPETRVRNSGSGDNHQVIGQVDYSNKLNENKRIEFGARTYYNSSTSHFGTFSIDGMDNETKLPLSNNYKYKETVNAGYFNYANKWKTITYQVGLRVELSKFDGTLIDSNLHFGYKYPDGFKNLGYALFPSFFLTKSLNENTDVQFNYSKRIRRPRFWEVDPFVDINDPLNIRQGNPALHPEYTNSFELNYFNRFPNNGGTFLGVLYFRNNVGDVTQYSDTISPDLYQKLNNAAISPDAILNTFINAGYTNRMGAEFTVEKKFGPQFDLTYNLDLQYRTTKASVGKINLDNKGFDYETKLIANYKIVTEKSKLFNNLGFQLTANYESPRVIPQGKTKQEFVSDFAMRKEFLKRKAASVSLSINDIFNSRKFGTIYDTEDFYQDSYRRWSVRTFRVTFSYRFGDSEFDLFKRKNNNNNNNNLLPVPQAQGDEDNTD